MPWHPDHYEFDDDPNDHNNSWDDMEDDYYYEEGLTSAGYSSNDPLAGYDPNRMWVRDQSHQGFPASDFLD